MSSVTPHNTSLHNNSLHNNSPKNIPFCAKACNLTVCYHNKTALFNINANFESGKITAIIGPNGAGKSTLLKTMLSLIKPVTGHAEFFDGKRLDKMMRKRIAYVPQSDSVDWDFPLNVLDVVTMGRYVHLGWFKRVRKEDKLSALNTLESVGLDHCANRQISELSGGQRQRVFLARALNQEADLYFMDEPFKGVDAQTEKAIIYLLKKIKDNGSSIVVVHHDLSTVKEYFDNVVIINNKLIAQGSVSEAFNDENIVKAYGKCTHI